MAFSMGGRTRAGSAARQLGTSILKPSIPSRKAQRITADDINPALPE